MNKIIEKRGNVKKILGVFFAVNLAFAMMFTAAYAQEVAPEDPPADEEVVVEETEPTEEVIAEETEEVVDESLQPMMMSAAAVGPTDENPLVLGLPNLDDVNQKYYGALCGKQDYPPCEKEETGVENGGLFEPTVYPNVVVIKTGGKPGEEEKEYFFKPSGPNCNFVEGGDPYCVTFQDGKVLIEVNQCLSRNKAGQCVPAKEISNIQFWKTGDDPDPTPTPDPDPTPTPRPGDPTPTPKPKPTKVPGKPQVYPEANTGALFGALAGMSWVLSGISGISLGIVSLKKKK